MASQERKEKIKDFLIEYAGNNGYYWDSIEASKEICAYMLDAQAPYPTTPPNFSLGRSICELFYPINEWEEEDHRLFKIVADTPYWKTGNYPMLTSGFFSEYVRVQIFELEPSGIDVVSYLITLWQSHQLAEDDLTEGILSGLRDYSWYIWTDGEDKHNCPVSSAGKYIIERANKDAQKVLEYVETFHRRAELFELIFNKATDFNTDNYAYFFEINEIHYNIPHKQVEAILKKDALKYEYIALKALEQLESAEAIYHIYALLRKYLPEKHEKNAAEHAYVFLDSTLKEIATYTDSSSYCFPYIFNYELSKVEFYLVEKAIATLLEVEADKAKGKITAFYKAVVDTDIKGVVLKLAAAKYGQNILPMLFDGGLDYHSQSFGISKYLSLFFKYLSALDYTAYNDQVWALAVHKDKKIRTLAALMLAKQGDKAIVNAEKMLKEKKNDIRQNGAFLLSRINTPAALAVLAHTLNTETDDDTRDIMLESLVGNAATTPQTEAAMQAMIIAAQARKKLDKPFEYWLDENNFPRLYWLSGAELTNEEMRFLFYRQTRSKDIRVDTENKIFLNFLDKAKSAPFANALIKAFIEKGTNTKTKYCLALATSLGSDAEIDFLKSKVIELVDSSRGKMAEYVVKAIALNGSIKSLRIIEFYSRKYKTKYKNIGAAANEAFELVAEELGIPPYELADSIIPDFGFEGLFKTFEAGGETYRAFVSNDFKILFLDEGNKLLKSIPKTASTTLKDDFKDIAKEIKDIVKSQSSRLEQYLVIQRKWNADKWQGFFLTNPVMFAYAIRLVWGVYSPKGELLYTFKCTEEQELYNAEGNEINLEGTESIGIVHPIDLDATTINYWSENLLAANITPIFPQLSRPVIQLKNEDKGIKFGKHFEGVQYGGYSFIGQMDKTGWTRGSVVDAGGISSFYKDFASLDITALIEQTGMIGIGYYEQNAELGRLMFVKHNSIQFGSYTYDEPRDSSDKRLIPFSDVPPIVYSEIMADLQFFKDNDAK